MIWLCAAAQAQQPSPLVPRAELRVVETTPDRYPVAEGQQLRWGPALDTRLRLGADGQWGDGRIALEGDVFSGQLFGATWNLPALDERGRDANAALTAQGIVPRRASVGYRFPWFDVEAGLQTSAWGLGMLANDGEADPLFGRTDFGDRVLRLRFATRLPDAPLYFIVAGDRVVADELARWDDDDDAWQGILAALYRGREVVEGHPLELGVYGVARTQRTAERAGSGTPTCACWTATSRCRWCSTRCCCRCGPRGRS
ncbi:MAG: hypothetical protein R3F59_35290 [Myxococcota bacterium]